MARCQWCTAPLPARSSFCRYCGRRNDVDLRGVHEFTVAVPASPRICPSCRIPMRTLDLGLGGTFLIERCERCLSLFFDPNEIETLLERSVDAVYHVDRRRLEEASRERGDRTPVRYYPCPVCGTAMNRQGFGARSGVIVDQCPEHGLWLEAGELRALLEWKRAGGQILDRRRREEREKERRDEEARRLREAMQAPPDGGAIRDRGADWPLVALPDAAELVTRAVRALARLLS